MQVSTFAGKYGMTFFLRLNNEHTPMHMINFVGTEVWSDSYRIDENNKEIRETDWVGINCVQDF